MPQGKYIVRNICFVIFLGFLQSQSYSISGKILNSKSKLPVYNVNIFIIDTNIGTTTDKEGYFHLIYSDQLKENRELNIKMMGYEELIIPIDITKNKICQGCLSNQIDLGEVLIKIESLELESIHIHAHQHKSSQISDVLLSGQKLNENLSLNLASTLTNQPNIGTSSFGVVTAKPVLRGFSGSRFLLTKNGSAIGDLSQTSIDHAISLEMTEIKEIEIIRGPKALLYGSSTIGGVINTNIIGDPKVKFDTFHTKVNIGAESFNNGVYGNLFFYIPIKNNQINLSINNRKTKNQNSPKGQIENTQSETANYKLGYTRYYQKSFINFMFENFNMDYGIPPSEEGHINGVDIELVKNTFQLNFHRDIALYNFNQIDIKYNFIYYEHGEYESDSNFRGVGLAKNTYNSSIELKSLHSIIGSKINFNQFSSEGFYWTPRTNEINMSLYGFWEKELNSYDVLSSFRLSHFAVQPQKPFMNFSNLDSDQVINRHFTYISSSIGIKRNFDNLEFDSWLMNTMRAPQLEELYSDGPHLGTYSYEIGRPDLELEKIYGIESSFKYTPLPFSTSLTIFYNYSPYYFQMSKMGNCDLEFVSGEDHPCSGADYIEWGSGASGWLYKYRIEGIESIIKGLEFNLGYHYKNYKLIYDFSLVRGENLTQDEPLAYINPDKGILVFEYRKKIMNYKFRFSKIYAQNRIGGFESPTESAELFDFIISYNNKNQNFTIQINNILNEEYYNHLSKIKSIMPESGRSIILNYKIFY